LTPAFPVHISHKAQIEKLPYFKTMTGCTGERYVTQISLSYLQYSFEDRIPSMSGLHPCFIFGMSRVQISARRLVILT